MAKGSGGTGKGKGGASTKRPNRAEETKQRSANFASAVKSGDIDKQARLIADELKASRWKESFLPNKIQIGETQVTLTPGSDLQKKVKGLR
jgi:hypothetical protein